MVQDTVLPTGQIRRVRRAHYTAVAYLALDEIGAARGIKCGLAEDQEGGKILLMFDTGCMHSITRAPYRYPVTLFPKLNRHLTLG